MAELAAGDLRVEPPGCAAQPGRGTLTGGLDAGRDDAAGLGETAVAEQFSPADREELDLHVDPVEQRAGQPGHVALTCGRGAGAVDAACGGPGAGARVG